MCNKRTLHEKIDIVAKRFKAIFDELLRDLYSEDVQFAFDHPTTPIIRADRPGELLLDHHWGLIPQNWNKPKAEIWNSTINAKIEKLHETYSYKNITHQRCLIPVTAYYEYHWNDPKGKSKTLYEIWHPDDEIYSLAGLWSTFIDTDGKPYNSYTVITTQANERMRFVHNKDAQVDYHRMPVMLNPDTERDWLDLKIPYQDFAYPNYKPLLVADPVAGK